MVQAIELGAALRNADVDAAVDVVRDRAGVFLGTVLDLDLLPVEGLVNIVVHSNSCGVVEARALDYATSGCKVFSA